MKLKNSILAVFVSALLLTFLFYKQGLGVNLLFFEILFFVWLFVTKQIPKKNNILVITSFACIFTAFCTVFVYSVYSYFIHFLALFVFIGALNYPKAKSIVTAYLGAWASSILSFTAFFKQITNNTTNNKTTGRFKKLLKFAVPFAIIIVFIIIYSNANAAFGAMVSAILEPVGNLLESIFIGLDLTVVFTYLFFFFVSIFLIIRFTNSQLSNYDLLVNDQLKRLRLKKTVSFKTMSLKNELKAGVFLLIALNILLCVVNFLDLKNVWFGFEWNGETLKEFVHEGTYLLILSILISIALVLYYFRKNLNL